jgi:hypothetical protein
MKRPNLLFSTALLALATAACIGTRVEETEHCTETQHGNVTVEYLSTGFNWELSPGVNTTCFPATQESYPGEYDDDGKPVGEKVLALTPDSVDLALDFSFEWSIPRETYFENVFKTKRNMARFEQSMANAAREAGRNTISTFRSGEALNNREKFGDALHKNLQRSIGSLAKVEKAYVRAMDVPQKVREAREIVFQQNLEMDRALKQRRIDSVNNVTAVQNAQTEAEKRRLNAQVYANEDYREFEIKKAQAASIGNICHGVTTCFIGANVADKFFAGVK